MSSFSRHWSFGSPLVAFAINRKDDWMAFALTDGTLQLLPLENAQNKPREIRITNGLPFLLAPDADDHGFLVGSPDGRVLLIDPTIDLPTELFHAHAPLFGVAGSPTGQRALALADKLVVLSPSGSVFAEAPLAFAPTRLAFNPAGKRLAVLGSAELHLFWTNTKSLARVSCDLSAEPTDLLWQADGKGLLLASAADKSFYVPLGSGFIPLPPSRGFSFDASGAHLLGFTESKILGWSFPFSSPPAAPDERTMPLRFAAIASHPKDPFTAAATDQGAILFIPHDGRAEAMILPATGKPLHSLTWSADGALLLAALKEGALLLFTPPPRAPAMPPGA